MDGGATRAPVELLWGIPCTLSSKAVAAVSMCDCLGPAALVSAVDAEEAFTRACTVGPGHSSNPGVWEAEGKAAPTGGWRQVRAVLVRSACLEGACGALRLTKIVFWCCVGG